MIATLNHDEFDEGTTTEVVAPHNIVYGYTGFTDAVDDATLDVLVKAGVVSLHATHSGPGWQSNIYVSRVGVAPSASV